MEKTIAQRSTGSRILETDKSKDDLIGVSWEHLDHEPFLFTGNMCLLCSVLQKPTLL